MHYLDYSKNNVIKNCMKVHLIVHYIKQKGIYYFSINIFLWLPYKCKHQVFIHMGYIFNLLINMYIHYIHFHYINRKYHTIHKLMMYT